MKYQLFLFCCIFLLLFSSIVCSQESTSFDMEEVSAFTAIAGVRGQYAECRNEPYKEVKQYPAFKSAKPFYGFVMFDCNYSIPDSGIKYCFAIDESKGTGKGYDLLYFDLNRDFDLTNDNPVVSINNPPVTMEPFEKNDLFIFFDYLTVDFDFGPGIGIQPFRIFPHLSTTTSGEWGTLYFTPTTARKGEIKIGNYKYDALIAQNFIVSGRFDRLFTGILLTPLEGAPELGKWTGSRMLRAMHTIDGKFYSFSTTPKGDKLFVNPYNGDLGIFEIGAGNRKIDNMFVSGCLVSENTMIPIGSEIPGGLPVKTKQCKIPVGEYYPNNLNIEYGKFSMSIHQNSLSDGYSNDRQGKQFVYGIKITKDKPFIFDFPNKPEILFSSLKKDKKYKLGETVSVNTHLIDPVMDMVLLHLKVNSQPILPTVKITNSSGEVVASGYIPYALSGTPCYYWQVPKTLKLSGKEEIFTITVTYETEELFGQVKGECTIFIKTE